jgi:hypothetical protein
MSTSSKSRPALPKFTGVDTFSDIHNRYQFRYPTDWRRYEIDGKPNSVLFSPYGDQESPRTFISAYASTLDFEVVAEDLEDLKAAVGEGLAQFADVTIERQSDDAYGNLLKFERTFTFVEDGVTRKRRTWILYVATHQIVFTYQGETAEDYEYWLPMGNTMFFHTKIPDSFWFATDRDLNGFGKKGDESVKSDA